jgi:hypothetical protein
MPPDAVVPQITQNHLSRRGFSMASMSILVGKGICLYVVGDLLLGGRTTMIASDLVIGAFSNASLAEAGNVLGSTKALDFAQNVVFRLGAGAVTYGGAYTLHGFVIKPALARLMRNSRLVDTAPMKLISGS